MGLDPEHPDYEPGNQCVVCKDILFGGITPKYVEVDLSDIEKCPDVPHAVPDGTFLLTQLVNPCTWQYFAFPIVIIWELRADRSILTVGQVGFFWFQATVMHICFDAFVNENVCGVGPTYGEGGYATCWWGPTIGP